MRSQIVIILMAAIAFSCIDPQLNVKPTADKVIQAETERAMVEATRQIGMPAIVNFQEKKLMKQIYELRDQENLICYACLFDRNNGRIGQFLGKCVGYGIPYSTQFSNPERVDNYRGDYGQYASDAVYTLPQPEPNGLFMPEGLSATWLLLLDNEGSSLNLEAPAG